MGATERRAGIVARFLGGAAVLVPVVVQAEPAAHGHQPDLERGLVLGVVRAEAPELVAPEVLEDEGVAVHHCVVVAAEVAGGAEQERSVGLDQAGPGIVLVGRRARVE